MKEKIQKGQSATKAAIIVGNTFSTFIGLGALASRVILPMAFDAPGSEKDLMTQLVVKFLWYFPAICLISIPLSWWQYGRSNEDMAQFISITPILITIVPIAGIYINSMF